MTHQNLFVLVARKQTIPTVSVPPPRSIIKPVKQTIPTVSVPPPRSIIKPVKQTIPTEPVSPPKSTIKPAKPTKPATLSSAERSNKWYQFEKDYQEQQKRLTYTPQYTQDSNHSPTPSSNTVDTDLNIEPIVPDIVPVPSYSLRTTAVCNPHQHSPLLSERTQSVHKNISIFQFYLTYNETNHSVKFSTVFLLSLLYLKTSIID